MMDHSGLNGHWTPLLEYANKKGVSMSTLRRYIKAGKIEYKVEQGRYLVKMDLRDQPFVPDNDLQTRLKYLETDLRKAQEEIAEMKMLIALYEEKISPAQL